MERVAKYFLIGITIIGGGLLTAAIIFAVSFAKAFGLFDKNYSVQELHEEYLYKEKEIDDLIKYYYSIKPDKRVEIEFENDEILRRLVVQSERDSLKYYQQWDVKINGIQKTDVGKELGWNEDDFKSLKEKLDEANCISIADGEPVKVGFKRSGLGKYFFNIFYKKETDRSLFNDGCQYILINNKLALEYGGGAIGPQCFPKQKN